MLHILFLDAEFTDFLKIGWDHIIDIKAYDHLLFIMVLCAVFTHSQWRKLLVIITAFTIGHSLTLALSTLDYIILPQELVEILIPFTILATALINVIRKNNVYVGKTFNGSLILHYAIALTFGLIHGLGFANNFKFMLGEESNIIKQLFAFNSGLEMGQIMVVIIFMSLLWLLTKLFKLVHREWTLFISGAGAGIALILLLNLLTN